MAVPAIKRFLDLIFATPALIEEVDRYDCKGHCLQCGLCVSLAKRHGLAITPSEMHAARRQFFAGELIFEGVLYGPHPDRVAAMKRAFGQRIKLKRLAPPPLRFNNRSS